MVTLADSFLVNNHSSEVSSDDQPERKEQALSTSSISNIALPSTNQIIIFLLVSVINGVKTLANWMLRILHPGSTKSFPDYPK